MRNILWTSVLSVLAVALCGLGTADAKAKVHVQAGKPTSAPKPVIIHRDAQVEAWDMDDDDDMVRCPVAPGKRHEMMMAWHGGSDRDDHCAKPASSCGSKPSCGPSDGRNSMGWNWGDRCESKTVHAALYSEGPRSCGDVSLNKHKGCYIMTHPSPNGMECTSGQRWDPWAPYPAAFVAEVGKHQPGWYTYYHWGMEPHPWPELYVPGITVRPWYPMTTACGTTTCCGKADGCSKCRR